VPRRRQVPLGASWLNNIFSDAPRAHNQQSKLIAHIVIAFNTNCPVDRQDARPNPAAAEAQSNQTLCALQDASKPDFLNLRSAPRLYIAVNK